MIGKIIKGHCPLTSSLYRLMMSKFYPLIWLNIFQRSVWPIFFKELAANTCFLHDTTMQNI